MNEIAVLIGECQIRIFCECKVLRNHFRNNYQPINIHNRKPDLSITIKNNYGVPFLNYEVEIINEENTISFRRADYLIEVNQDFTCAKISVHNELALKHAMMNLYSAYIVHHNWGLLIHSSCVIDSGEAHIFAGQSGDGKSTAAKLSYPRELLSDEATIVKVTENGVIAFDSPFRSELRSYRDETSYPVGSIQILTQDQTNRRLEMKRSEAFVSLLDKVFYWTYSKEETRKIMKLMKTLVDRVPAYKLHFQKNNTFWELIS